MSVDEVADPYRPAAPAAAAQDAGHRPSPPLPPRTQGGFRWVPALVTLLVLAGAGTAAYQFRASLHNWLFPQKTGGAPTARPVPVQPAIARCADLQLYVRALGTVTAYNSITIHTRIDGNLDRVYFTEGQDVKAGDLLAEIDPRPYQQQLNQAVGQLAKDQAALANDKQTLQRDIEAGDAVSKLQLDAARASVTQDEGVIVSDQASKSAAELNLTYCHITAPLTGHIGLRLVDPGNMVHATDPNGIAVINQFQPIAVKFAAAEDNLPRILRAMAAGGTVPVEAYNRDLTTKLATGSLLALDSQIDPTTGMVLLKAKFDNTDSASMLFPNQFVNIRLLVETRKDVVVVPTAAVQHSPTATFVYRIRRENSTVEMRTITEGATETMDGQQMTEIKAGLEPGDEVVTEGVNKLVPDAKVILPSPASQPGSTRPGAASPPPGSGAADARPQDTSPARSAASPAHSAGEP